MDVFYKVVSLLGGLSLFLYGMRIMGDALKSSSGGALKSALAKVTNKAYMSFLLGLLVTCMIQSSTATIVLTVGLVGAGFLTFRQSIGIVLGANVGTSITAQIIRLMDLNAGSGSIMYFFKSDNLAPMALIVGIVMIMFLGTRTAKNTGTIFMGFGILFVGLMNMSAAVSTMSESLSSFLVSFESNYFLGFLAGVITTGIIQSSSAVVGILQSVASSVGIRFCAAFAVILGVNIGDCITTYLVCRLGAKPDQIKTCLVHIIYNVFALFLITAVLFIGRTTGILNDGIWYRELNSGGVANVHGLFRLVPAVVLLPFTGVFAAIAERIVGDRKDEAEEEDSDETLRELDRRLLANPGLALAEIQTLIGQMGNIALKNYVNAMSQINGLDEKKSARISERENLIDNMADASNAYLMDLSPNITLDSDENNLNFQQKAIICFERIGDLACNILNSIKAVKETDRDFSVYAKNELSVAADAVSEILQLTVDSYSSGDTAEAKKIEPCEEVIDELIDELKERHLYRMRHQLCGSTAGLNYQEILQNLERISDQCSDLGVYLLSRMDNYIRGMEHRYIHNLHHSPTPEYQELFERNYAKYFGMLKEADDREKETEEQK